MTIVSDQAGNPALGEDFNYDVWTEQTTLRLVNVPWNSDYRDIVRFDDQADLDSWIASKPNSFIDQTSFQRFQQDVYVDIPANRALKYNYLVASNPEMPVPADEQRNYYYFINNVTPIAPNTTQLSLQLDVWQTFGYEATFGNCFIERGHIGIANTKAFDNYGRDYLDIPEGLDVGAEYRIVKTAREQIMGAATAFDSADYSVLLCSIIDMSKDPGNQLDPKLNTATGSVVDGIASGASFYVFPTVTDFKKFLATYSGKPWITQGIISITIIPEIHRYHPGATLTDVAPDIIQDNGPSLPVTTVHPDYVMYSYPSGLSQVRNTALAPNWRDDIMALIPEEYSHLKKFLTFPYSLVEITTWTGKPLIARPEAWADDDATIREQAVMMPPSQRIAIIPVRYNGDDATVDSQASDDDRGEYLDFSTAIDRFPTVPIVNDMAISFLAANNSGLGFAFSSADWSQQRALRGANVAYQQETQGINLQGQEQAIGAQGRVQDMGVNLRAMQQHGVVNMLSSPVSGAAFGPQGFVAGGVNGAAGLQNTGISGDALLQSTDIANQASLNATRASQRTGEFIRDTNRDLARFAARGDYHNAIAGTNARIQDARLSQPSTSGQFGGDAMNLAHARVEIAVRFKLIDKSALRTIGNYWLRYGYAVNQFSRIPNNFMCMTKFTYWKLSETYINPAPFPEGFKQIIRGIFEKGVTVWKTPEDIGSIYWWDNETLSGITLD